MNPLFQHYLDASNARKAKKKASRGYLADHMSIAFGSGENMEEAYHRILKEIANEYEEPRASCKNEGG